MTVIKHSHAAWRRVGANFLIDAIWTSGTLDELLTGRLDFLLRDQRHSHVCTFDKDDLLVALIHVF